MVTAEAVIEAYHSVSVLHLIHPGLPLVSDMKTSHFKVKAVEMTLPYGPDNMRHSLVKHTARHLHMHMHMPHEALATLDSLQEGTQG